MTTVLAAIGVLALVILFLGCIVYVILFAEGMKH